MAGASSKRNLMQQSSYCSVDRSLVTVNRRIPTGRRIKCGLLLMAGAQLLGGAAQAASAPQPAELAQRVELCSADQLARAQVPVACVGQPAADGLGNGVPALGAPVVPLQPVGAGGPDGNADRARDAAADERTVEQSLKSCENHREFLFWLALSLFVGPWVSYYLARRTRRREQHEKELILMEQARVRADDLALHKGDRRRLKEPRRQHGERRASPANTRGVNHD